jgi:hypothetical protein
MCTKYVKMIAETRKLFSLLWKHLEAHYFRCFVFSVSNPVQNSENSELPDASI